MIMTFKQLRELVPMTQGDLSFKSRVSLRTIVKIEQGLPVMKIKAQAILDVLNRELLAQGKIQEPLVLDDVEDFAEVA